MGLDDPAALDVMRRAMVARIATLSRNGRPSINPLYFVYVDGRIWLGTVEWTLAARNVRADARVSVLLEVERGRGEKGVLRIRGRARVRTDRKAERAYKMRAARKYMLTPGGLGHYAARIGKLWLMRRYHAQSVDRGRSCVIEVTPWEAELV